MRKVVAAAVGVAAGAFAVGAAFARIGSGRREEREPAEAPTRDKAPAPKPARDIALRDSPLREEPAPRAVGPWRDPQPAGGAEFYTPSATAPFGPYHGTRRPPGLPTLIVEASGSGGRVMVDGIDATAARAQAIQAFKGRFKVEPSRVSVRPVRHASAPGAALRPIAEMATKHGHGEVFVKTITHLAKTEGEGGTFAVPARNFNTACTTTALHAKRLCTPVDAPRDDKRQLITAWGVFQWNRDAGRDLKTLDGIGLRAPFVPDDWMPWDWSAAEEIAIPINYYAQIWALVRQRGGAERDAARGMRLWHVGPTYFRRYLDRGAGPAAWIQVDAKVASRIDHHLTNAGVV